MRNLYEDYIFLEIIMILMLQSIAAVLSKITTTNIAALIVGLTCIVLLLIGKEINLRFKEKLPVPIPMEILVVSWL